MDSTKITAGKPHRHAEMIKAKADNMDLVLFRKTPVSDSWELCRYDWMPTDLQDEFFACLPQHKEACLHWLKSGEVQYNNTLGKRWCPVETVVESYQSEAERLGCSIGDLGDFDATEWSTDSIFMKDDYELRIKPRKEKRWIGIYDNHTTKFHFLSKEKLLNHINHQMNYPHCAPEEWQLVEIEIEV